MKDEYCEAERDALLIIKGKTIMLDQLTDMVSNGISFKEAVKIALTQLRQETTLIGKNYIDKLTNCGRSWG